MKSFTFHTEIVGLRKRLFVIEASFILNLKSKNIEQNMKDYSNRRRSTSLLICQARVHSLSALRIISQVRL